MIKEIIVDASKIFIKSTFNTFMHFISIQKELSKEEAFKILNVNDISKVENSYSNLMKRDSSPYIKNIIKNAYIKLNK